jgi:type IV fimbrial biogenesis protein FimT
MTNPDNDRLGKRNPKGAGGFTLTELMVTVAVIGVVALAGVPYFLTYLQASKLRGGAEELATVLNQARQLAIRNNTFVCVQRQSGTNRVRFLLGNSGCTGTTFTGVGTRSNGDIDLADNVEVSATTANVVFNYLGAATSPATFTVRNPTNNRTLSVIVASSGRVTIQ